MTEIAKISKIAENCRIRTRLDYVSQPGVRPKSSSVLLSDVSPISPNSIVPVPKPRLLSKSRSRLKQPSKVRLSSGTNISITSKTDINNNTTSLTNFSEATNFKKNANKSASNSENILNNNNKIEAQKTSTSSFASSKNKTLPHQTSSNFSKNQTNKAISSLPVPKTNISNCKLNDEVRNCTYNKIWGSSDMAGTNKSDRNMKNLMENTEASENPNPVKSFGDLTKNSTINKSKLPLKSRKKPIFPEAITNKSANNIRSVSPNNNNNTTNSNNNNMPIRRSNLDKIRESKGWIDHKPRLKSTNVIKERVRLAKDMGQNQTLPKKLHKTEKLQKVSSAAQGINNANKSKTIELASKNYNCNNDNKIKNKEEAQKLTDSFIDNKIQLQKSIENQSISQVSDKIKAYNTASKLQISAVNYKELEEAEQNLILQLSGSEKDKDKNNKSTPPVVPKRAATTFSKLKTQISQSSQPKSENNNNNTLPLKSLVLPKSLSEQNFQNKQPRSVKVHLFDHNDSTDFSSSEVSDGFHNKKLKKRSKDSSISSISSTEIDNFLVQFPNYTSSVSRKINTINNNNPSDLKPSASSYCLSETTTSSSSELCEENFSGSETPRRKKLNLTSVSSRCSNMLGQKSGNKVKRSRSSAALSKFNRGLFWKKKPQQILEEGEETAIAKTKPNNSDLHSASLANIPSPPNMFVPPPPSMDQTTKKLSKQFEIDTKTTKSKNVNLDLPIQDISCNTSIGHRLAQNSQVNLDNPNNNNENIYQARPLTLTLDRNHSAERKLLSSRSRSGTGVSPRTAFTPNSTLPRNHNSHSASQMNVTPLPNTTTTVTNGGGLNHYTSCQSLVSNTNTNMTGFSEQSTLEINRLKQELDQSQDIIRNLQKQLDKNNNVVTVFQNSLNVATSIASEETVTSGNNCHKNGKSKRKIFKEDAISSELSQKELEVDSDVTTSEVLAHSQSQNNVLSGDDKSFDNDQGLSNSQTFPPAQEKTKTTANSSKKPTNTTNPKTQNNSSSSTSFWFSKANSSLFNPLLKKNRKPVSKPPQITANLPIYETSEENKKSSDQEDSCNNENNNSSDSNTVESSMNSCSNMSKNTYDSGIRDATFNVNSSYTNYSSSGALNLSDKNNDNVKSQVPKAPTTKNQPNKNNTNKRKSHNSSASSTSQQKNELLKARLEAVETQRKYEFAKAEIERLQTELQATGTVTSAKIANRPNSEIASNSNKSCTFSPSDSFSNFQQIQTSTTGPTNKKPSEESEFSFNNSVFLNEQNDRNRHTSLSYRNVVLNIILKENFYEKMETVNLNEDVLEIGNLSVASNMGWAMLSNEILTIVKHFLLLVGERLILLLDMM